MKTSPVWNNSPMWNVVRLGDIAKTASGGTPKRSIASYYGGSIPWVKSGELADSTVYQTEEAISEAGLSSSSAKVFPAGTLCIALYGATVGKLGILGIDAATNQAVCGIFLPKNLDTRFTYRYLESMRRELIEMGKGGAQSNISQEIVRDLQIPLPPLPEQHRIVEEIEKQFTRLDAGVAALKRVQANLKRYRASVLKAACEGRLVPTEADLAREEGRSYEPASQLLARILTERRKNWNGRGRYKEPVEPDTSNLPELLEGWVWGTVEQVSTLVQYGSSSKTSEDSTGIPVLRMGNIQACKILLESLKYLPTKHDEFPELFLMEGDVLFNRTNSAELVGKTAVYKGSPSPCSYASYLIRVRLASLCSPDYLSYLINSIFGRSWIATVVSQQVGQANVNGTKLQALAIPLPPYIEQARIVAEVERRLSVVEELEGVVAANLQRAGRLRQAVLKKAFSGGLTQGHPF